MFEKPNKINIRVMLYSISKFTDRVMYVKLKIDYMQLKQCILWLLCVDFFVQYKRSLPDVIFFFPTQSGFRTSLKFLCATQNAWLTEQNPQFCFRKRYILFSWLLIAGRFLWLHFGKENWCFWLEMSTSVLHSEFPPHSFTETLL